MSGIEDLDRTYEVVRELGRGAFATVYLARERTLHRLVAIKLLHLERAASDAERERFVREARTAAHLDHPGIVPVLGFGETPASLYMVMRYVGGESLADRLARDGRISPDETRRLLIEIVSALAYAHRQGIVHRDLKPENVLLASDDSSASTARLLDFGVAAFRTRDLGMGTRDEMWGTPTYMSPEQALGEVDLDARSDIYSLGLMGYVMLAGRTPFHATNPMERLRQQQDGPIVSLRKVVPNAPAGLVDAIERCLAYDPAERWQRAADLLAALMTAGDEREAYAARDAARRLIARPVTKRAHRRSRRAAFFTTRPSVRRVAESARDDLRYAVRALLRTPGFALAALLTFAIGIGANATMFGVIDRLLLEPPAHVVDPERVVRLAMRSQRATSGGQATFNYPLYKAIRDNVREFEHVAVTAGLGVPYGRGETAQSVFGLLVSASYFPMLGVRPERGRFFTREEDVEPEGAPVVVISHGFWQRNFGGDRAVLGKTMDLGQRRFTIIGVAPRAFSGIDFEIPDVWMPITAATGLQFPGKEWATRGGWTTWLRIYGRLRTGVSAQDAARATMRMIGEQKIEPWNRCAGCAPDTREGAAAVAAGNLPVMVGDPITKDRREHAGAGVGITLLLGAMSTLVLLIACANVGNLLLARGLRRRREIAVRLALGVSRLRLIGHFLIESLVLAVLGGIAALIVAGWGGRLMHALLFAGIPRSESLIDGRVLLFTALAALATGVLAGSIPAWQNSRADLTHALKSGAREGGGHHARARTTLLAVQAALSVLLVVGAGLFVKSVRNLNQLQLGVDIDRVLEGRMKLDATGQRPEDVAAIFDQMLARAQRVRGVQSAAITTWTPFGTSNGIGGRIPGNPERVSGFFGAVSPDFFRTIGARVIAGRAFTVADDRRAPMTLVVSDTLAKRYWPGENAIGKCIQLLDTLPCAQIVGVVENIKRQNIHDAHAGFVFLPIAQLPVPYTDRRILIRAAGADAAKRLIEPVRRAMQTAAPNLPYASVGTIREQTGVGGQLRPWEIGASLFTIFGVLAVLLAAVGLYGVISYSVTQRTHEMGVRIALGAQPSDVARMVVRDGVLMTVAGVAIGLVVALLAGRFVGSLLFNVSPRDPLVLAIAPLVLLTIAAVASSFPAWRAMRVDPVVALKAE